MSIIAEGTYNLIVCVLGQYANGDCNCAVDRGYLSYQSEALRLVRRRFVGEIGVSNLYFFIKFFKKVLSFSKNVRYI